MDPTTVLTALAELAPAGQQRDQLLNVTGGRALVWLRDPYRARSSRAVERFAAMDLLHRDERLLRRGWGFVLGVTEVDGAPRQVRLPLLAEPVRLRRSGRGYRIVSAGDLEVTPLVTDRAAAARLESAPGVGSRQWLAEPADLVTWLRQAALATGLVVTQEVVPMPHLSPPQLWPPTAPADGLAAVGVAGLYLARDVFAGDIGTTLRGWAARSGLADTALAAVYPTPDAPAPVEAGEVLSPLPLNTAQQEVVRRARTEPVTVVSGPPGSGKSHAVAAAALDIVDRGGSVLLATQSSHAADVLGELLARYPGPNPVLFGNAEHREQVGAELAAGMGAGYDAATLKADQRAVAGAADRVRQLAAGVDAALRLERRAAELGRWEPLAPALRADAPGAFGVHADLARAAALADRAERPPETGWQRLGRQRAERRLRRLLGASRQVPLDRLRAALEAGRASQAAAGLASAGGTDLAVAWRALHEAEATLAEAVGAAMRHQAGSAQRWTPQVRGSAAGLATALRAGRNRRRELLAGMDGAALVRALPLWVGTAADAEDLLPPAPGLFDLVILDEASHLDQLRAAPVLARGRRALVVGDPRQLRFVSFVADVDVTATLHRHGLDDRVDVRRVSAFDLAARVAPVTWLDEHYRSVPHLIEFSARRFYRGRLRVATRHPANDARDAIDVVRVPDGVVTRGVNAAEVAAAVAVVRDLAAAGDRGIAVVSPFRAQADALESALLTEFTVAEVEQLGLRVGTVHAFQGSEAATVVASLGLTDGDAPARTRFVADPHLFNVLVTRARERMVVVTSLTGGSRGPGARAAGNAVVADYLAYSDAGPRPPEPGSTDDEWSAGLATELRRAGLPVRHDYPVGHWRVDLCVGGGAGAVGLITGVHPDGVTAHRRRQRELSRAGWRLADAYPSRWAGDSVRAALELSHSTLLHQDQALLQHDQALLQQDQASPRHLP